MCAVRWRPRGASVFVFERSEVLVAPGRGSLGWTQKESKVEGSDPEQENFVLDLRLPLEVAH